MKSILFSILVIILMTSAVNAETLVFSEVLDKAVKKSYDLRILEIDTEISNAGIKEARSEYFPILTIGCNSGYNHDLSGEESSITPVGDTILLNSTRYQNFASLGVQYNLFDFGVRNRHLLIAKNDKAQKQTQYSIELRDLKIKLADLYTNALLNYKNLLTHKEILKLNNELFSMKEKLYESGSNSRAQLVEQAIIVAKNTSNIDKIRSELQKNLQSLSFYTGDEYSIENTKLLYLEQKEFETINFVWDNAKFCMEASKTDFPELENLPERKYYQLEIEKKQAELEILKRQRLPQFKFYTNYYLYGTDKNNYWNTFNDIGQTNLSFRIASTLPIFTGFNNTAKREKVRLEIEKIKLLRDKQIEQIKNSYKKMYQQSGNFVSAMSNQDESLKLLNEKITMLERLNEQKLIDKVSYLSQKADLIEQKYEWEKAKIENEANEYKMKILRGSEEATED